MAQTDVQKVDSIRFGSGVIEVDAGAGFVNLGAMDSAVLTVEKTVRQFIAANAKLPPKSSVTNVTFAFNMYELDMTFLNLVNSDTELSNIAGTPVSITTEALGTGWTVGNPIKLANKNGDNTVVTSIVIDADATPLVLNTDYAVYVGDGSNGELGYTYINPLTAQAGVLDADYDYTPNASKELAFGDQLRDVDLYKFRFTHTNDEGKIFRIDFFKAYNSEGLTIAFQGDEDEDPANTPVTITAFPDSSVVDRKENLFKITDEISVT
jgi:hypothetical protein